jgi:haloacetate dehalogenase
MALFPGFAQQRIATAAGAINLRRAGSGPAVLLLHGYPQTHVMWHPVAPVLALRHTVIAPDLPGYGDSVRPEPAIDHMPHSKRAMAATLVQVMRELGHQRFAVVGHDRGARVAYRMALDHADAIAKLVVLDIVPTLTMWDGLNHATAMAIFHWPFLAQPRGLPEAMIGHDPIWWVETLLSRWAAPGFRFNPEAMEEYQRCFRDPSCILATCEDYRAGATCDLEHDRADFGRRKITAQTLTLWGHSGLARRAHDPLEVWRGWALNVRGHPLDCGHFVPEEKSAELLQALEAFL